jgi:hypothetical protein
MTAIFLPCGELHRQHQIEQGTARASNNRTIIDIRHKVMLYNTRIKIFIGIAGIALMIIMPLEIFHVCAWLVIHCYELLEFILDEIIHHLFNTSRHTTQIIVFYLMLAMFLSLGYAALRKLHGCFMQAKTALSTPAAAKKAKLFTTLGLGGACLALLMLN